MEKKNIIYAFKDADEKVFYIGKTCRIQIRKREHLREVEKGNKLPKYNKLRKLLKSGLLFEDIFYILEENLSYEEVDEREIYYITKFREYGYKLKNLTEGGEGGDTSSNRKYVKLTEGQKNKIRDTIKESYESGSRKKLKHSEETKKILSELKKGKKFTDEHKKKLSIARKKRIITKETREKCSKTSKGKINIKKYELTDPDGNVYVTENGLTLFCEEFGLTSANMSKVISGERKHHKGWVVRKIEN